MLFLCSWEKSDGSPSHILKNGPSFDDQSCKDECCKTRTKCKNNEKAYISVGRWDVQTHTNQRSRMLDAFSRLKFLYSTIQQIETKNWSKMKFNLANVNAKSNCFGTLTVCVWSCMPAVFSFRWHLFQFYFVNTRIMVKDFRERTYEALLIGATLLDYVENIIPHKSPDTFFSLYSPI